jgi:hypothetical protein
MTHDLNWLSVDCCAIAGMAKPIEIAEAIKSDCDLIFSSLD